MKYNFWINFSLWILLNILAVAAMELALFTQTTFEEEDATMYNKLLTSEFWATIQWFLVPPLQRIGNTFLNPAQLGMSSYVFNFLAQIVSNKFWLDVETSIDDYAGMFTILFGMFISTFRMFG